MPQQIVIAFGRSIHLKTIHQNYVTVEDVQVRKHLYLKYFNSLLASCKLLSIELLVVGSYKNSVKYKIFYNFDQTSITRGEL